MLDGSSGKVLRRMKERFYAGLLLAVAMLVYGDSLENDFTQDDELYVVHNETVTSPSIRGLFEPNRVTNVFRPVTFSTFALNWAARGARPFGYHLVNLLLHAAVTLLLYLLLEALLEPRPQARTVAFVAALLFAVHPIHAEAVASVVDSCIGCCTPTRGWFLKEPGIGAGLGCGGDLGGCRGRWFLVVEQSAPSGVATSYSNAGAADHSTCARCRDSAVGTRPRRTRSLRF